MLELRNIVKRYRFHKIIDNLSMELPEYGLIAIIGPSGCGKSTLLHIIGGIDKNYQGKILYKGKNANKLYRKKEVGFLFQAFHLIQWLNIRKNIMLPLFYRRNRYPQYKERLDINDCLNQKVYQLSLGQRQRACFLRVMSFYPKILLCDEPTASLDSYHALEMMKLLKEESKKRLVVFVSHDLKLVDEYSDEIYYMKDGKVINHEVKNSVKGESKLQCSKSLKKPRILLSIQALRENKTRMLQVLIGLILSLTTILMTLSLSQGFHQQLNLYIESMIPPSSISFRLKNHQAMDIEKLTEEERIKHIHLYPDQYELLGISDINEKYVMGNSIDIYDDSGYLREEDLLYGRLMNNEDEIVLSHLTVYRYLNHNRVEELINKEIMLWFKYSHQVRGCKVKVVGISKNKDTECVYYKQGANLKLIQSVYKDRNIQCSYGLMFVDDQKESIEYLEKNYKTYEFKEVGKSTKENIDSFMVKVKYVLLLFSSLAILSSLFLIGEVMFLEVVSKRKDIAIMKCFGAKGFDVVLLIFYQSVILYVLAVVCSFVFFIVIKNILNAIFQMEMLINIPLIILDFQLFSMVYLIGFLLLIFSIGIPLIYALKLNTVDSLKINS